MANPARPIFCILIRLHFRCRILSHLLFLSISASRKTRPEYPDREFRPNQHQSQKRDAAKHKPRQRAFYEPQYAFANDRRTEKQNISEERRVRKENIK